MLTFSAGGFWGKIFIPVVVVVAVGRIPRFQLPAEPPQGKVDSIRKVAQILGMNTSTNLRWLAEGIITGERVTAGMPWRIRITEQLRARIVQEAPPEYLPMLETTMGLGVSRQTALQRVEILYASDPAVPSAARARPAVSGQSSAVNGRGSASSGSSASMCSLPCTSFPSFRA